MALMGTHFNAAEAIGVLTNVSPVIHMEVFGWDVKKCFSPHVDRKNWIEVKCQGWYLSFVHLSFSLLEIVNQYAIDGSLRTKDSNLKPA